MANSISKAFIKITTVVFAIIITVLAVLSFISTVAFTRSEKAFFLKDPVFLNVLVFLGVGFLFFLIQKKKVGAKLSGKLSDTDSYIKVRNTCLIIMAVTVFFWNMITQYSSVHDAKAIQNIVEWMHFGNFSEFYPAGYMGRYPSQCGLLLVEYLFSLIVGPHHTIIFLFFNSLFYVLLGYELFYLLEHFGVSREVQFLCWIAEFLFIPTLFYTSYLYGHLIGLALSIMAFRREIQFFTSPKNKIRNLVLAGVFIALAIIFKQNYMIFWIVMFLYALIELIKQKKLQLLAVIGVLFAGLLFATIVPKFTIEKVTGVKLDQGYSTYCWITTGLQNSDKNEIPSNPPGWFTDGAKDNYNEAGYDTAKHTVLEKERLKEEISGFTTDPSSIPDFFIRKITTMWCDPLFESVYTLRCGHDYLPEWVVGLTSITGESILSKIFDPFQFLIYAGVICYLLFRRKELYHIFGCVFFCGGFLCHFIWEGKGQYAFPYYIVLIPYGIIGIWELAKLISNHEKPKAELAVIIPSAVAVAGLAVILFAGEIKIIRNGNEAYKTYIAENESTLSKGTYYVVNCGTGETLAVKSDSEYAQILCDSAMTPIKVDIRKYGEHIRFCVQETGYFIERYNFNNSTLILQLKNDGGEPSWRATRQADGSYILLNENDWVLTLDAESHELTMAPYAGEQNQAWEFVPAD